jgi:hypothetical protein
MSRAYVVSVCLFGAAVVVVLVLSDREAVLAFGVSCALAAVVTRLGGAA